MRRWLSGKTGKTGRVANCKPHSHWRKQGHRYRQPVQCGANTLFGRLANMAAELGLDPLRFEKATNHWMRHTFVRQALVDGAPIYGGE